MEQVTQQLEATSIDSPPILSTHPPKSLFTTDCPFCKCRVQFELDTKAIHKGMYRWKCWSCKKVGETKDPQAKPNFGTDDKPLERGYYDILEIDVNASQNDIKKAYRKLAVIYHPDKNQENAEAEERFKEISKAYQILSDPQTRAAYNKFGSSAFTAGGGDNPEMAAAAAIITDPNEFFKSQFGGDGFVDIIGDIAIAKEFGQAISQAAGAESASEVAQATGTPQETTPEEEQKRKEDHERRVEKLAEKLANKLDEYSLGYPVVDEEVVGMGEGAFPESYYVSKQEALDKFTKKIQKEMMDLRGEPFGVQLLHAVGYTYRLKANHHVAKLNAESPYVGRKIAGFGSKLWSSLKEKTHVMSETFGTIKTAYELQNSFTVLQELEEVRKEKETGSTSDKKDSKSKKKLRELTVEQEAELVKKLEAEAADKGIQALWRGSKLEVQSVIREVCDKVLADNKANREERRRRCLALDLVGSIYESATPVE